MPITPLHLGILAPINHWLPGKVNNLSFWLVTLWLDASAIGYYALSLEMGEFYGPETHSFIAAVALANVVGMLGFMFYVIKEVLWPTPRINQDRAMSWFAGAFLGGFSHVLLNAMVHSELEPFHPIVGNPFYWGGMSWISLLLVPPLIWLTSQYVHNSYSFIRHRVNLRRL